MENYLFEMVRVVGLEPTLLSEPDFESGASTNSTTPAHSPPILADALCTYIAPRAKTEDLAAYFFLIQAPAITTLSPRRNLLWIGRQTSF